MASPLDRFPVGVVVERRNSASPWTSCIWRAAAVLAGAPDCAPWTEIRKAADAVRFFAGTVDVELYRSESANYRDNLASAAPSLWVVLRPTGGEPPSLLAVTADPVEAEAFTEPGTDIVEAVEMPPVIQARIAAFVAEHPMERPFQKRERDCPDPEGLSRRIPFSESKTG